MNPTDYTAAPADETELGVLPKDGTYIEWPDADGDLHLGSAYLPLERYSRDEILRRIREAGGEPFERTISRSVARRVEDPLPAVGSIARADVVSPLYGDLGRETVRRVHSNGFPWVVVGERHSGAGVPAAGATNVEVLFDAGASS